MVRTCVPGNGPSKKAGFFFVVVVFLRSNRFFFPLTINRRRLFLLLLAAGDPPWSLWNFGWQEELLWGIFASRSGALKTRFAFRMFKGDFTFKSALHNYILNQNKMRLPGPQSAHVLTAREAAESRPWAAHPSTQTCLGPQLAPGVQVLACRDTHVLSVSGSVHVPVEPSLPCREERAC